MFVILSIYAVNTFEKFQLDAIALFAYFIYSL